MIQLALACKYTRWVSSIVPMMEFTPIIHTTIHSVQITKMADNLLRLKERFNISDTDIKTPAPATKLINNVSVSTSDVQIDPSRGLWLRLFVPSINSDTLLPLIVYFHGGGFRRFGPDNKIYDDLCTHMAAKVPAFTDLSRCFVGGDSSGANIAHHVTVRVAKNQFNKVKITGHLSVQPFFGGEEATESELRLKEAPMIDLKKAEESWRELLPEGADKNHPAVNVTYGGSNSEAGKELKNLEFPPTLVIVGGIDPLQDRGKMYAEWLKNCGKEAELIMYQDAFHAFYFFPEVPEFDMLIQTLRSFIQKHVHPK